METSRLIFAAVAFATLASTTSLARHGAGKPGSLSGAAHHGNSASSVTTEPAVNAAGVGAAGNDAGSKTSQALGGTGAARHGIDLVRPDDGYASPGLRRRATRSALIAKSDKRHPTIVLPMESRRASANLAGGRTSPVRAERDRRRLTRHQHSEPGRHTPVFERQRKRRECRRSASRDPTARRHGRRIAQSDRPKRCCDGPSRQQPSSARRARPHHGRPRRREPPSKTLGNASTPIRANGTI